MGGWGAQRPFLRVNEPKKNGARSLQVRKAAKSSSLHKRSLIDSVFDYRCFIGEEYTLGHFALVVLEGG